MTTLVSLNHRGFLPLEGEAESSFLSRVALLEQTGEHTLKIEASLAYCTELFDVRPDWVSTIEQQQGLTPWQGAVTWIQEAPDGSLIPLIQISPRMQGSFLQKWYSREEILAHEFIHAVRLPLNSTRFEEFVAYQTSRHTWRRWLGPILRHPYEVYILLAALILSWIGMWVNILSFLVWTPWAICLFGLLRLTHTHRVFNACRKRVAQVLNGPHSLGLTARLTDAEVELFARSSPAEIRIYISNAREKELRWQMLCAAYPTLTLGSWGNLQ